MADISPVPMELQTKEAYNASQQEMVQGDAALLQSWLSAHFDEKEAAILTEFFYRCRKDMSRLYRMYGCLWTEEKQIFTVDGQAAFTVTPEKIWITDGCEDIAYAPAEWKRIIGKAIAFLENLLPLGSVVELKKEYLEKQVPALKKAGQLRMVITERYLTYTGNSYFPYAGVPYPTGMFPAVRRLLFSPRWWIRFCMWDFRTSRRQHISI